MSAPRMVVVLTGVPGVGKTTAAGMLAERLGGTHIDLSDLAEREGLITGWDEQRGTGVADLVGIRDRLAQIRGSSKEPLIVGGHFAADIIPPEKASFIFVLRRAPWRLKEELEARGYGEGKVRENVEAELLDVCLVEALEAYGPERVCEIDTTNRTPGEVVEEILSIISGEGTCRRGYIDWFGCAESEKLLEDL